MFPLLRNSAARALDLAIEFATLGEYGLASPLAPAGPSRGARRVEPSGRRSGAPARPAIRPPARIVVPATAAARLAQAPPPDPATRVQLGGAPPIAPKTPTHTDPTRLRPVPMRPGTTFEQLPLEAPLQRPAKRTRKGAVDRPPQPCETPRR
jgi:hypothetical protein